MTTTALHVVVDIPTYPRGADSSIEWEATADGFWSIVHRPSGANIPAVMLDALSLDDLATTRAFRRWAADVVESDVWDLAAAPELALRISDLVDEEEATRLRTVGIHVDRTKLWRIDLGDDNAIVYSRTRTWIVTGAPANQPPLLPAA